MIIFQKIICVFESDKLIYLQKNNCLNSTSSIPMSNPFIGKFGLLRISKRLLDLHLPFEKFHPIILRKKAPIVYKIIWQSHIWWIM